MKYNINKLVYKYVRYSKNGETRCANCGAFCQGIKDPTGKILCPDCYRKLW